MALTITAAQLATAQSYAAAGDYVGGCIRGVMHQRGQVFDL